MPCQAWIFTCDLDVGRYVCDAMRHHISLRKSMQYYNTEVTVITMLDWFQFDWFRYFVMIMLQCYTVKFHWHKHIHAISHYMSSTLPAYLIEFNLSKSSLIIVFYLQCYTIQSHGWTTIFTFYILIFKIVRIIWRHWSCKYLCSCLIVIRLQQFLITFSNSSLLA